MKIQIITLEQKEKWDEVIRLFPQADVYYQWEYVTAFFQNKEGTPICLFAETDVLQAISIVMKREVPVAETWQEKFEHKTYYDYVTPYGYGGFLIQFTTELEDDKKKDVMELFEKSYFKHCLDHNIVAEFVRFHPVNQNEKNCGGLFEVEQLGPTVCLDVTSKEVIWQNMTSKNRNLIRKAKNTGVNVFWGREPSLFSEFESIYNATMDKVNASKYYYFSSSFYKSICNDLKYNSLMFYATLKDEIIAMSIVMFSKGAMHYHLSASKQEFSSCAPTNLLLYEAACWGSSVGINTFHLGGGLGSKEGPLYHFKKQFNRKEDCSFHVGRKIYNKEVYEKLCQMNQVPSDTPYFPAYRGIK